MDIDEIRRANINYWADKLGRSVLAEKAGYKDTIYINQLCKGHGSFGSRTARKIEKSLGLEKGWFDQSHTDTESTRNFEQGKLIERIKELSESEQRDVLDYIEFRQMKKRGDL